MCCNQRNRRKDPTALGSWSDKLLALFDRHEIVRIEHVSKYEIPRVYLTRAIEQGAIRRVGRGTYVATRAQLNEETVLTEIATRMPTAIVSLWTAAAYFGLAEREPDRACVTLLRGYRAPRARPFVLDVHTELPATHGKGARAVECNGVEVRIYGPARTVADAFKHRGRWGLERARTLLAAYRWSDLWDPADLARHAAIARVGHVLEPCLAAIAKHRTAKHRTGPS